MALTQSCGVMQSGEPGLLGVFDYEYEEYYDCCAHHESDHVFLKVTLFAYIQYVLYIMYLHTIHIKYSTCMNIDCSC